MFPYHVYDELLQNVLAIVLGREELEAGRVRREQREQGVSRQPESDRSMVESHRREGLLPGGIPPFRWEDSIICIKSTPFYLY